MKQTKARVEDAMHASRAAVEEGIVPGGGGALARCATALNKLKLDGDEQVGVNIVKRALQEPLRQIAENGGEEGASVLGKVLESKDPNFAYNALTGEYEDLVKAGVFDPTKVERTALTNAGFINCADANHRSSGRRWWDILELHATLKRCWRTNSPRSRITRNTRLPFNPSPCLCHNHHHAAIAVCRFLIINGPGRFSDPANDPHCCLVVASDSRDSIV
jgi:TCP-1/cpn60 chaperonin family